MKLDLTPASSCQGDAPTSCMLFSTPAIELALVSDFSVSHGMQGRPLLAVQCVGPGPKLEFWVIKYSRFLCYEVFFMFGTL